MKAIVSLSEQEHQEYSEIQSNLNEKIKEYEFNDLIHYRKLSGCAKYNFSGTYTDKLVEALGREPKGEEIIMLVDGGFSHFGASCSVHDGTFSGYVYID